MQHLKRILLVEDNAYDIELTLDALDDHNLRNEVLIMRDGAEALAFLRREGEYADFPAGNPAMVMLDLKLPKVDGLQVLAQMRADPALKAIPVIMLTSSREESDLVKSYELGVNAYVVKPVDFNQFVEAVQKIGAFWALLNEAPPGSVR